MDFDFQKEYTRYNNVELLRMLHLKEQYQPEAIAAVRAILASRDVTEEEQLMAEEHSRPEPVRNKQATKAGEWQTGDDLFADAGTYYDHKTVIIRRRIIIILLALAILYDLQLQVNLFFRSGAFSSGNMPDRIVGMSILIVQVASYVLLVRQKKWGWILTISWIGFMVISNLSSLSVLVQYNFFSSALEVFFHLLLLVLSAGLLLTPALKNFYQADRATVTKTLAISLGCSVLYCASAIIYMYLRYK